MPIVPTSGGAPAPAPVTDAPAPAEAAPTQAPAPAPAVIQPEAPKLSMDWGSLATDDGPTVTKLAAASQQQENPPEKAARVLELSGKTGVPSYFINDNLDEFEKQYKDANFSPEHMVQTYPKLAQWMANDPQNFHLAKDDLPALKDTSKGIEDYIGLMSAYGRLHAINKFVHSAGARENADILAQGTLGMAASVARIPNFAMNLAAMGTNYMNLFTGVGDINAKSGIPTTNDLAEFLDKTSHDFEYKKDVEDKNYDGASRTIFRHLSGMVPMTAAILADPLIAIPLLAGGEAANTANREENKAAPLVESNMNALTHGAIFVAMSEITQGVFGKMGETIAKEYGSAAANAVLTPLKKLFGFGSSVAPQIVKGAATEAVTGAGMTAANKISDVNINPNALDNIGPEMAQSAADFALLGTVMASPHFLTKIGHYHNEKMATLQKDAMLNLEKKLEETKMKKMAPDQLESVVESLTKDTPVESVHVSAEALHVMFQDKPEGLAKIAHDLGIEHTLDKAKEYGGTVEIPTSKWFSDKVSPETRKALLDDVTFDPSRPTMNEVKRDQEILKAQEQMDQTEKKDPTSKEVQRDLFKQLVEAGHRPADASKISLAMGLKIATTAMDNNMTAAELYKKNPFTIGRELPGKLEPKNLVPNPAEVVPVKMNPKNFELIKNDISQFKWNPSALVADENGRINGRAPGFHDAAPYLLDKGYNKKDLTKMIDKAIAGKKLTHHETEMLENVYKHSGYDKKYTESKKEVPFFFQDIQHMADNAPAFYNQSEKIITEKMGTTATVKQVEGMLSGIKAEERKWLGIDEFLKGKEKVSKQELLDFIRGNSIEIKEVEKGGSIMKEAKALDDLDKKIKDRLGRDTFSHDDMTPEEETQRDILEKEYNEAKDRLNKNQTKFGSYQLPGGSNYREVLFTLPEKENNSLDTEIEEKTKELKLLDEKINGATKEIIESGASWSGAVSLAMDRGLITGEEVTKKTNLRSELETLKNKKRSEDKNYKSSHFEEKNILAHTRLNDRVDSEGKKVLFAEEIQSDWHQAGRKKGYKGDGKDLSKKYKEIEQKVKEASDFFIEKSRIAMSTPINFSATFAGSPKDIAHKESHEAYQKWFKLNEELSLFRKENPNFNPYASDAYLVPDAPLRKTWHEFVFKKLIREAAESGHDKIGWTTGEQQADRYKLRKFIEEVHYSGSNLKAYDKSGKEVVSKTGVRESDLPDLIGKEAADRLLSQEPNGTLKSLKGEQLEVGGEGMKGFYDKMLVDFANKFGKKFGSEVKSIDIKTAPDSKHGDIYKDTTVHSLEITPALREAALREGFPLFQENIDTNDKRGAFWVASDGAHMALLKDHDLSTALHESMHYYVHLLNSIVSEGNASQRTKEIFDSMLNFAGAESFDKMTEAQHEKLSDAYEKYLAEGKAPSEELRSAFATFKVWMMQVYDNIKKTLPKVKLNDEIRTAFDRMLATDSEIAKAKETLGMKDMFNDKPEFVNDKEWEEYQKAKAKRDEASDEYMTAKLMAPIIKRKQFEYKMERNEVERQVTEDVNSRPEYRVLDAIKDSKLPDGRELGKDELKLSRKETVKLVGAEAVSKMPKGIFGKDGSHPDVIASMLHDNMSGTDLVMMLANSHPKDEVIHQETEAEMSRRHAGEDPVMNGSVTEEAVSALHSGDHAAEAMAYELRWMKENQKGAYNSLMRKVNTRLLTAKAFSDKATAEVKKMSTRDLKAYVFERAEAKHGNEALSHFIKGDFEKAFESRYKELLNHEIYKKVKDASIVVEKALDSFKDLNRSDADLKKTRDIDVVNSARVILNAFGIGSEKRGKSALEHLEKLKRYDEGDRYNQAATQINAAIDAAKPYGDISFHEFVALRDTVDALVEMSKNLKQVEREGQKRDIQEIIEPLRARIAEIDGDKKIEAIVYGPNAKKKGFFKTTGMGIVSSLARIEHLCHAWSGGDPDGIWTKEIHKPVFEGEAKFGKLQREYRKKVQDLINEHLNDSAYDQKMIGANELNDGAFLENKGAVLTYLLHSGNESNLRRLLIGYGWGSLDSEGNLNTEKHDQFLGKLFSDGIVTEKDMKFVQGVWDLLEELKPDAQRAYKNKYGTYFDEISEKTMHTPFGEFRGGYFPAAVDPEWSNDRENADAKKFLESNFEGSILPMSPNGFTKTRIEGYNRPLSLNLDLISSHIDQVLKFSHIGPAVDDVAKLLYSKELSSALKEHDPTVSNLAFTPWLKRTINQSYYTPSKFKPLDAVFRYVRNNLAMQKLVANPYHMLQILNHGYNLAALRVRPDFLMSAKMDYIKDPKGTVSFITSHSTFMENRMADSGKNMEVTLHDIVVNPSKVTKSRDFIKSNAFFMQHFIQSGIDIATWKGAFEQAASEGHDDESAAKIADSAVSQTQHNSTPSAMSGVEHGTALSRLFTSMYGFQNLKANLMGAEYYSSLKLLGIKNGMGRAAYVTLMGSVVTAAGLTAISSLLSKKDEQETDYGDLGVWEGYVKKTARNMAQDTLGFVPVFGKIANYAVDKATGTHSQDPILNLTPLEDTAKSLVGTAVSIYKHGLDVDAEFKKKEVKDALNALGLVTGLPTGPLERPINYYQDVQSGKANPTGSVDFTRGLITGH